VSRAGLIEALRRNAAQEAAALWRDARAEADKLRLQADREIEEQRVALARQVASTAQRLERSAVTEAERQARDIRASAAAAVAERLYRLATAELPRLREEQGQSLFDTLAAELPSLGWQRARVNPADETPARRAFPQAHIECDAAISGGLEVEAQDGRIRVSNTLETRLAGAWPDLLPVLIAAVCSESSAHRTVA
jgi:vacuolar-type H+-ATPase subunit E/Vma4